LEAASIEIRRDGHSVASVAAMRFAQHGVDLLAAASVDADELRALAMS
jgi:hypothetical protein